MGDARRFSGRHLLGRRSSALVRLIFSPSLFHDLLCVPLPLVLTPGQFPLRSTGTDRSAVTVASSHVVLHPPPPTFVVRRRQGFPILDKPSSTLLVSHRT